MKLNKLFWALMVVALPLSFTACSSSDDDGVNNDSTPYNYKTPANKAGQGKFKFDMPVPGTSKKAEASVSIDPSKTITIKLPKGQAAVKSFATRAEAEVEYEYTVGNYVKNANTYTVTVAGVEWGSVTVTPKGNGDEYALSIEIKNGQTITADAVKATPVENSAATDKLCRTWIPVETRVMVKKKGAAGKGGGRKITGCDFNEVKKVAAEENCEIDDEFGKDYVVTAVSFDNAGGFTVKFNKEENSYVSQWRWSNGDQNANPRTMTLLWETEVNSFIPSEASVDHKTGNFAGQCWLRFMADVKSNKDKEQYDVELVIVLKDAAE